MDQTTDLQKALVHHQAGRLRNARTGYESVLKRNPDDSDALHLLGVLESLNGDHQAAVQLISRAIELQPNFPEAYNSLGNVHKDHKNWPAAETAYKFATALKPNFAGAYLNLGVVARQRGDLDGALSACEKAIAIDPTFAPAHFNRGNALREMNRLTDAAQAYRETLAKDGQFEGAGRNLAITLQAMGNAYIQNAAWAPAADAYAEARTLGLTDAALNNNHGNALKNLGHLSEALDAFAEALRLDPSYAAAHNNIGTVLEALGEPAAAIDSYQHALDAEPEFPAALNNLGNALRALNRATEAVSAYKKALATDPDFLDAQFNIAHAHKEAGDFNQAERAYDQVLTLEPDHPGALRQLASLGALEGRAINVNRLRAKLDDGLTDLDQAELAFALARFDEDLGQTQDMFAMLATGNAAKRRTIDYDVALDGRRMQSIAETFTAELLNRSPVGNPDDATIFIVGMPRSGTSLVEQILASHPEVYGAGELMFMTDVAGHGAFPGNMHKVDWADLGRAYMKKLRARAPDARRITDKMPHNFLYLGLISMCLPNAKIIHCTRAPEDTCLSLYKTLFTDRLDFAYDLSELGAFYGYYADLMDYWRATMPGNFLDFSYEALVANQESETRRVLDHLHLPWDAACMDFHKTARRVATASNVQVRQKLYNRSVDAWRPYADHLAPLIKALPAARQSAS